MSMSMWKNNRWAIITGALLLILWEIASRIIQIEHILPGPISILRCLWELRETLLIRHLPSTLAAVLAGFILSAWEILNTGKEYTDDELRKLLSGHLCRCTGYENIFRAVKKTMLRRLGKYEEAEKVNDAGIVDTDERKPFASLDPTVQA